MKKLFPVIAAALMAAMLFVCGCNGLDGADGRDGKDGQDVTIYSAYEAAKTIEGNEDLTFEEFLKQYLSYDDGEIQAAKNLQATMNKSLMAGVSILSRFEYVKSSGIGSVPGFQTTSHLVYTGSGVILWLDKEAGDAYVATNCHVIYDDTSRSVYSTDIRLYLYGQDVNGVNFVVDSSKDYAISGDENYCIPAEIVGASVSYDIALLKVSGSSVLQRSGAVAASFSMEDEVYIGESVYAVGNPSTEGMSASTGVISKDSEDILLTLSEKDYPSDSDYNYYRVLRTTVPINGGNSGGALYNNKGEIVAIVNAKDESEGIDNMGYALPANTVRRVLGLIYDGYAANGYKMRSGCGIDKALLSITTTVSDSYSRFNEQKGVAEIFEQVKVKEVSGYPALGKLKAGDYLKEVKITSSDGTEKQPLMKITRTYQLTELMLSVRKGDTVSLTIERAGAEITYDFIYDSDSYFYHYN